MELILCEHNNQLYLFTTKLSSWGWECRPWMVPKVHLLWISSLIAFGLLSEAWSIGHIVNDCISQQPCIPQQHVAFESSQGETRFVRDKERRVTISKERADYERTACSLTTWIDSIPRRHMLWGSGKLLNIIDPCFFPSIKNIQRSHWFYKVEELQVI